jgi:hypothetical protein
VRTVIEVTDDDPLHRHAQKHDKHRAGDYGGDVRARIFVGDITSVTAKHEHRAVREIEHAKRAINNGQPGANQRQQCAECQPVEYLRKKIRPIDHEGQSLGLVKSGQFAARLRTSKRRGQGTQPAHGAKAPARSGVGAEIAAERVRLLHQPGTRHDLDNVVVVLLILHILRRLAPDDDHRPHELVVFCAEIDFADG